MSWRSKEISRNHIVLHIIQWICVGLFTLIVGGFAAWWLVPFAYAERGYSAIGGEWLVVFDISFAVFQIGTWLMREKYEDLIN